MVENEILHGNVEEIDAGESLISWETWEFPLHIRSTRWYVIASVLGVALIVYAVLTTNYLFAIIVLMIGVLMLVNNLRKPHRILVHITTLGVVLGEDFHSYKEIKDFSVIYEPPDVKILYVDFVSRWHPIVAIPLEDIDPNMVRDTLLPYAFENIDREDEGLTDMLRRVYKI